MKVDRYGQDKVETVNVDVISSITQNCGMREAIPRVLSAQKSKICTKPTSVLVRSPLAITLSPGSHLVKPGDLN